MRKGLIAAAVGVAVVAIGALALWFFDSDPSRDDAPPGSAPTMIAAAPLTPVGPVEAQRTLDAGRSCGDGSEGCLRKGAHSLRGTVRLAGAPVAGAKIELDRNLQDVDEQDAGDDDAGDDDDAPIAYSDSAGNFHFDGQSPGQYAVSAESGMQVAVAKVLLVDEVTTVQLELVPGVRFIGTVFTEAGRPIDDAVVAVNQDNTGTVAYAFPDAGHYDLLVEAGDLGTLSAQAEGYAHEERRVSLDAGVQLQNFVLRRAVTVEGVVVDEAGRPIVDATLSGETFSTTTDALGKFSLGDVAAGQYTVHVREPSHESKDVPLTAPATHVRITLDRGLSISGRVELESGEPVPDVSVMADPGEQFAETGPDGHFVLSGLQTGPLKLMVFTGPPSSVRGDLSVTIGPTGAQGVRLVVRRSGILSGTVEMSPKGPLVHGISITATSVTDPTYERHTSRLYDDRFQIEDVLPGAYMMTANVLNEVRVKGRAHTDRPVQLIIPRGSGAMGHVVDSTGKPITSFSVNTERFEDENGGFAVTTKAGPNELLFSAHGHADLQKHVEVAEGVSTALGDVVLIDGRALTIEVIAGDTRAPLEGVHVMLLESSRSGARGDAMADVTGADGRVTLRGLTDEGTLTVFTKGYAEQRVTFTSGELEKRVVLGAGGQVTVRAVDAAAKPVTTMVGLIEVDSPDRPPFKKTDPTTGEAVFLNVRPGHWEVLAQLPSFTYARKTIEVTADSSQTVVLRAVDPRKTLTVDTTQLPPGLWTALLVIAPVASGPFVAPRSAVELGALQQLATASVALTPPAPAEFDDVAPSRYTLVLLRADPGNGVSLFSVPVRFIPIPGQVVVVPPPAELITVQ